MKLNSRNSIPENLQALTELLWEKFSMDLEDADNIELPFVVALYHFGLLNSQVNNGGFMQYFDNGYASWEHQGCMHTYEEVERHEKTVEDLKEAFSLQSFSVEDKEVVDSMFKILDEFTSSEIDLEQYYEEIDYEEGFEDEDGDWVEGEEYTYEEQNPDYGIKNIPCGLDDRFYNLNNKFIAIINKTWF